MAQDDAAGYYVGFWSASASAPSLYDAVKGGGRRCACCAVDVCFGHSRSQGLVEQYGRHQDDRKFIDDAYSLLEGQHECEESKIEIEDTESAQQKVLALERLRALLFQIVLSAGILWTVVVCFAIMIAAAPELLPSSPFVSAVAGTLLLWRINVVTDLLSKTTFEGRPFVRFMVTLSGLDDYRALAAFALLDLSAKFSSAIFVAHALSVGNAYEAAFEDGMRFSFAAFVLPGVRWLGFGGFAGLSFAVGALFLQGGLWLRSMLIVRRALATAEDFLEYESQSMGIDSCLDDFGALADVAFLVPVAKVLSLGAIPLYLDDDNDAYRLWDRMLTETARIMAHVLPDTLVSLYLQATLFDLSYADMDSLVMWKCLFLMFCSWASAMNKARLLLQRGYLLTVVCGCIVLVLGSVPCVKVARLFM